MDYQLALPRLVRFGWGRRVELGPLAAALGRRAIVVPGSRSLLGSGEIDQLEQSLRQAQLGVERLGTVLREPLVGDVQQALDDCQALGVGPGDVFVAIGGGSAIDLAKATAALVAQPERAPVQDYLEGVGRGLELAAPPLPLVALPTTAGTGTEATKNAVISSLDPPFKKSLRSDWMVPTAAIIDPQLAVGLPATTTTWTGMDAITQLIESYVSRRAQPIPRSLVPDALRRAVPALLEAVENPASRPAREALAHAAFLSGVALANSGLGLAHGVAAALGVHAHVPHGLACAVMLPVALRVNRSCCEADFASLTRAAWPELCDMPDAAAADALIDRIDHLGRQLRVPRTLAALRVRREQLPLLVQASRGNSMQGNPQQLDDDQLAAVLEQCYD